MILIGSAHITVEMVELAKKFGFETIVIDPRDTFAKKTSYDVAPDQLFVKWPQEVLNDLKLDYSTYAVILSHDPKIDDEALKILLKSDVRYIGALGSKRTHAKRVERLKGYGFSEEEIHTIHAPIGVPINALLPKEIALSVMAEVINTKNTALMD
jgi:xanthine dehydrogenase accessory factor